MTVDREKGDIKKAAALRYDKKTDSAPRVIASGRGWIAEKIIDEARKRGIPLVEDSLLVSVLLGVNLGEEIPEEAYLAVARILVFLSKIDSAGGEVLGKDG
ncbi:EscU/YscU/HrcU family type III secretion system export apparatus switch protein [Acetomicrobium hydrogeniformans]|uniref:Flagellar biosynthesis n=1 Tax=Acetomicrobium hydrogeniformans TaxID=649746 RepID=A0A7V6ZF65_9BACT|nr:EscU/YscU/HrcU family type III secretion system export apparatus switch protein [Acetomicrobium hydrogeniformans]HHZ04868.1 flagellar biosynthesis [Acetomicrobium hydrogeniformans]